MIAVEIEKISSMNTPFIGSVFKFQGTGESISGEQIVTPYKHVRNLMCLKFCAAWA